LFGRDCRFLVGDLLRNGRARRSRSSLCRLHLLDGRGQSIGALPLSPGVEYCDGSANPGDAEDRDKRPMTWSAP
jgi:hypothetical protein